MRRDCVNCGKIINPKTLICDCCGTDYNEKPKCEHLYTEWKYSEDPIHNGFKIWLKCERCGEFTELNCSKDLLFDLIYRSVR